MDFTSIAVKLLFVNGFILSFGVMQKVMEWNLIPDSIESFVYGIIICFEIFVMLFYLIAVLSELKELNESFRSILDKLE